MSCIWPVQAPYSEHTVINKCQKGHQWEIRDKLQASCDQEGVWVAKALNQKPERVEAHQLVSKQVCLLEQEKQYQDSKPKQISGTLQEPWCRA